MEKQQYDGTHAELDDLAQKLTVLKDISADLGDTVDDHDTLLDTVNDNFSATTSAIQRTAKKIDYMLSHKKVNLLYIVLLALALGFVAYLLISYLVKGHVDG